MSGAANVNTGQARSGPTVVLAGGVGAARYLRGVVRALPPEDVTVVVNTGDDRSFCGVHVSPDLDIVTYTLADRIDPERGFGLAGDTYRIDQLSDLGHESWFRLGDADYANCLHRTLRMTDGQASTNAPTSCAAISGWIFACFPCRTTLVRRGSS